MVDAIGDEEEISLPNPSLRWKKEFLMQKSSMLIESENGRASSSQSKEIWEVEMK